MSLIAKRCAQISYDFLGFALPSHPPSFDVIVRNGMRTELSQENKANEKNMLERVTFRDEVQ